LVSLIQPVQCPIRRCHDPMGCFGMRHDQGRGYRASSIMNFPSLFPHSVPVRSHIIQKSSLAQPIMFPKFFDCAKRVPGIRIAKAWSLARTTSLPRGHAPLVPRSWVAPTRTIAPRPVPGLCKCLRAAFYLWGLETFFLALPQSMVVVSSPGSTCTAHEPEARVRSMRSYEISEGA
jgi:hypothetical protein